MEKFLLAFSLTVTFATLVYSNQRNSLLNHQSLILTKEREIFSQKEKELQSEIDSLKSKLSSIEEAKVKDSNPVVITQSPKPIVVPQEEKLSRPEWEAKVSLRKVEERLALTADERAQLEERFKNGAKLSSLSEVVGEEKAERFFEEEENARKAEEEEVLKEKLFKLSRVLGLNSDQEIQVTQVLKSSTEVLKKSYIALKQQEEKAIALHSEPNSGGELRAVYEKYRTDLEQINNRENSILTEEFRRILSEEQLNKFLEYQATEKTGLR